MEPVPVSYSDKTGIRLTMRPAGSGQVKVDPYPFNQHPCRIQLAFRRLRQSSFENLEAFHRAYFQAENDLLRFELV